MNGRAGTRALRGVMKTVWVVLVGAGCGGRPPEGAPDFAKTNQVTITLGDPQKEYGGGLQHIYWEKDGRTEPRVVGGAPCRCLQVAGGGVGYFYFKIDPAFKRGGLEHVRIEVEYYDGPPARFGVEYDASEASGRGNAYAVLGQPVQTVGAGGWWTARFEVKGASFRNAQNSGADFRLWVRPPRLCVRRVRVKRLP